MSLRSKVVIENNLKPSKFGKPALPAAGEKSDDDFEEIYENPLEKSKPSPPSLDELPRNEPEIMEFSNESKNLRNSNNLGDLITSMSNNRISSDNEKILTLDKPSSDAPRNYNHAQRSSVEDTSTASSGFINEGFDDPSIIRNSNSPNVTTSGNNQPSEKLVANIQNEDPNRNSTAAIPSSNNEKNDRFADDNPDISFGGVINAIKSLDVNRYATKKTIAQGMLDIALLTANASQLKYILQIGKQHEFYILMLSLICVSIGLQIVQGVICVLLGSSLNINKQRDQRKANIWNNICLVLMVLTVAVNAVISAFDMRDNSALTQANTTRGAAASSQLRTSGGR